MDEKRQNDTLSVIFCGGTLGAQPNSENGFLEERIWDEVAVRLLVDDADTQDFIPNSTNDKYSQIDVFQPFVKFSEEITPSDLITLVETIRGATQISGAKKCLLCVEQIRW